MNACENKNEWNNQRRVKTVHSNSQITWNSQAHFQALQKKNLQTKFKKYTSISLVDTLN